MRIKLRDLLNPQPELVRSTRRLVRALCVGRVSGVSQGAWSSAAGKTESYPARKEKGKASMEGTIWHIYPVQEKGMIRGDGGHHVPFRKSTLDGVEFRGLFSGLRVTYQIQDGWLGKEAVAVRPLPGHEAQGER